MLSRRCWNHLPSAIKLEGEDPVKPLRIALFAPGIKDRVMAKALESSADAVILDLEDSVPIASKAEARSLVAKAIDGAAAATRTR